MAEGFKKKVEDSPAVWLLATLASGFLAGLGAYATVLEMANLKTVQVGSYLSAETIEEEYVEKAVVESDFVPRARYNQIVAALERDRVELPPVDGPVKLVQMEINEGESLYRGEEGQFSAHRGRVFRPNATRVLIDCLMDEYSSREACLSWGEGDRSEVAPLLDGGSAEERARLLSRLNPVFDVVLLNEGSHAVVLTRLDVSILDGDYYMGDTGPSSAARALEVASRYRVDLLKEPLDGRPIPLDPPIHLPSQDSVRIQLELTHSEGLAMWFVLRLRFLFSDGTAVSSGVFSVDI